MVLKSFHNDVKHNFKLKIRPAVIEDTKGISAILAKSFYNFPDFAHWLYPLLRFTINEDLRYRLRSTSPYYRCLVAQISLENNRQNQNLSEDDAETVIVGTTEIALRSSLWSTSPQHLYISNLAVAQDYRRLGIGSQLLKACEQAALDWGYQETRLHVLDCNDSAKQLYCQHGYQISQIEPNWGKLWFDSPRLLLKKIIQTT